MKIYTKASDIPLDTIVANTINRHINEGRPAALSAQFNAIKKATLINLEHKLLSGLVEIDVQKAVDDVIGFYIFKTNNENKTYLNALRGN